MVSSPQNKTYSVAYILLKFTSNEPVTQISYSIDGRTKVTISKNSVTLPVLSDGSHSIVIYASDLAGNNGASQIIYFTVDTQPPNVSLLSPQTKIYNTTEITLTFAVNETVVWTAYSVDEKANIIISGNKTLQLADGMHSLVVYTRDLAGNIASSAKVYFTIDTVPPSILLLSPKNQTYDTTELLLNFTLNETASWIGYSLDGQETVTITGNTTLTALSYRQHTITVYATDSAGNTGSSETIHFSVP
jgi:hypothetical protein